MTGRKDGKKFQERGKCKQKHREMKVQKSLWCGSKVGYMERERAGKVEQIPSMVSLKNNAIPNEEPLAFWRKVVTHSKLEETISEGSGIIKRQSSGASGKVLNILHWNLLVRPHCFASTLDCLMLALEVSTPLNHDGPEILTLG